MGDGFKKRYGGNSKGLPGECSAHVQLFATPWTAARQASLSFIVSWSLLKLMSTESVMPSNHLIPGEGLGYRNMKKGRNVVEQSACTLFVHYPVLTFSNHVYGVFLFPIL